MKTTKASVMNLLGCQCCLVSVTLSTTSHPESQRERKCKENVYRQLSLGTFYGSQTQLIPSTCVISWTMLTSFCHYSLLYKIVDSMHFHLKASVEISHRPSLPYLVFIDRGWVLQAFWRGMGCGCMPLGEKRCNSCVVSVVLWRGAVDVMLCGNDAVGA